MNHPTPEQMNAANLDLLRIVLDHFAEYATAENARRLLMGTGRQRETKAGPRPAWVKLAIPDSDVKALSGPPEKSKATYMVVRIPEAVLDEIRRQSQSRIVLPGKPEIGRRS